MTQFEVLPDGSDIAVLRGAIEPALLADLQDETQQLFHDYHLEDPVMTRAADSPGRIETYLVGSNTEVLIVKFGFRALGKVLDIIGRSRINMMTVNYQEPFAAQCFHFDTGKDGPVTVLYPEGFGALEYVLPKSNEVKEVELEAGDVIELMNPAILHRGVNKCAEPRRTLGVYRPLNWRPRSFS